MGFFSSLFGKKETKPNTNIDENKYNPENKRLDWFSSEDGLKTLKDYTSPKCYLLEDRLKKEYDDKDFPNGKLSFVSFVNIYHKKSKIPSVYFDCFVNNINVQPLKYVGPSEAVTNILAFQAKNFVLNDDGEPEVIERGLKIEDVISLEKNPVLKFVKEFKVFELNDDDSGSWSDKFALYLDALYFLAKASDEDTEILNENMWLLEKETYFNSLGVIKSEKTFYKYCISKSTYPKYFENELDKLDDK